MTIADRGRGALLGLAVGDALGGPVEFMSREDIVHKRGRPVREMIGGGWLNLQPGETTDDTAMARALAESLAARAGFDADDVARRYLAWLGTGPKDVGNITRLALKGWQAGLTLPNAALGAHRQLGGKSAGNGTIMRCAPLALRYIYDERRLLDASRDDALITHFDAEATTGSMALNLLIYHLCRDVPPAEAVKVVAERLQREPKAALTVPTLLSASTPNVDSRRLATTGYVLDTLRIVVWALLAHETFEDCVAAAVNCGGDADTQGAVAGALAGARWGYRAIPARWLAPLHGHTELLALADQLLATAERARLA